MGRNSPISLFGKGSDSQWFTRAGCLVDSEVLAERILDGLNKKHITQG